MNDKPIKDWTWKDTWEFATSSLCRLFITVVVVALALVILSGLGALVIRGTFAEIAGWTVIVGICAAAAFITRIAFFGWNPRR